QAEPIVGLPSAPALPAGTLRSAPLPEPAAFNAADFPPAPTGPPGMPSAPEPQTQPKTAAPEPGPPVEPIESTPPPAAFSQAKPGAFNQLRSESAPLGGSSPDAFQPIGKSAAGGGSIEAAPVMGSARPGDRSMEGRQQPSLAIQKFAPAEVQIGKPARFVVKVRNVGQRPAQGVVVRDQTPAGARLTGTTPQAQVSGDQIAWQLGELAAGEERTLEMEVTPTEEGDIGSVATVTFSAQATAKSRCTRPQLAVRMTAPSQVQVGRQQRIQITLHNPGTGDATGVMLFENVPEQLRHAAGPQLEFEVGTLRAGETRQLELVMQAAKPGRVLNQLTASADGNLSVDQQVEFDIVAPDLSVALTGPKRRYLERPATYTVKIDNPGTATAKDVRLVTRLPRGMQFVKANNLGEYDRASHSVYWSLAELPEGSGGEVQLTALPTSAGEQTLQVEGEARDGLKVEDTMAVRVEGVAALEFNVLDVEDPIDVGSETVYEVRVSNSGTKAATGVAVRFVTPPGLEPIAASGETRHQVQGGDVVFAPLERLAPQGESLFRIRCRGTAAGDQRLRVELSSDDLAQPVVKEESTRVFGDE
ncbi:MAG: hypothetical protein AAGJ46_20495, partial [Planctomycetota bacterium]